ncbi:dihydroxyacetone phosphate acyltransferase-like [Diaphorina citri]|uniref:Dihydroxyacetone phosphate acyltransferase-like n=1 Tax=Diaphorina citri TaxID=121845 RepID=A0A3Q0ITB2_DIACI|nr:dihydroxyacetone phosphate acyltransferase-like [Diaphorina citri]
MSISNKPSGGRSLKHFVDILEPRRHGSDLAWVFRSMELTKAYDQLRSLSHPDVIKYNVLESEETASIIHEFSLELSLPKEQIRLQVLDILNEIGYGRSLTVVRWLGLLLVKILKKTRTSVYVNEEQLNKLRKQWGDNPVLFLPSHRSYGDFILMALLCFHYNIEIPCVAAGMDFHSMFLMGNMLRGCSAYFMRRTYGTDKLYWRVFDVYVQALVTSCVAPLEFFIEGTRSRTGKSLYPKLGKCSGFFSRFQIPRHRTQVYGNSYHVSAVRLWNSLHRDIRDSQSLGELGFIKAVNTLNEQYGKICMDFADPISVRQFLASVNTQLHSNRELCLAHHVLKRQQNSSVISPFNVLSILLSHHYIHRPHLHSPSPPVVLTQATSFLTWFSGILENFGALVDIPKENVPFALEDCMEVHKSLVHISRDENTREKVLCVTPTRMNVTAIDSSKLKGVLHVFTVE